MYDIDYEREMKWSEEHERLRQLKKDNPVEYEKVMVERKLKKAEKQQAKELKCIKSVKRPVKKAKKQEDVKYKSLSKKEKVHLADALKGNNPFFKNLTNNSTTIIAKIQKNITVKTFKDAVEILVKLNLVDTLNLNVREGENFECKIVKGNIASINVDTNGHYKYFTKSIDGQAKYVLDIIDLFEIIYNVNYYRAVNTICKLAKIEVEENTWVNMQKIKYADNIAYIENVDEEMAVRYPVLYRYVEKHLYLLKEMNCLGIANIATQKEAVDGESIFFASARFIEEELKDTENQKNQATINKVINMFCSLGLIEKIPAKEVPKNMIATAKAKIAKEDYTFAVTFYRVPDMDTEVLLEAEKRVGKLNKAKVSALQISSKNLETILGKRVFKAVYADTLALTEIISKIKEERASEYKERREMKEKDIDEFADIPFKSRA